MIEFFDTSALVKNYAREAGSPAVRTALRGRRPVVARVTHVELACTFARLHRDGAIDERTREELLDRVDADFPTFEVIEWRARLARTARTLASRHPLRALDAVQLSSALALGRPLRFWCTDGRLAKAASAEGFRVVRPG